MHNPNSRIMRVKYQGRETSTEVMVADNLSVRHDEAEGFLILELFRSGAGDKLLEGMQFHFCPEDADRIRHELNDHFRRHQAATRQGD